MREGLVFGAALVGVAVYLGLTTHANAMTSVKDQDTSDTPGPDNTEYSGDTDWEWVVNNGETPIVADNLSAFRFMIRSCEHKFPQNVLNDACYGIFYSGNSNFNAPEFVNQRFSDFTDHPVITGVCKPVPLPPAMCANAGLGSGCVSTAAGAYQIIRPTWNRNRALSPRLPDFSPASQDECCNRILQECGALEYILQGDINNGLIRASRVWESLPFAKGQQNPKKLEFAMQRFYEGLAQPSYGGI